MAPILLKRAVDGLGGVVNQAAVDLTVRALLLSGACRILNSLAKEAQGPTFTPVAQSAGRRVAYHTFSHVLDLDINFHLVRGFPAAGDFRLADRPPVLPRRATEEVLRSLANLVITNAFSPFHGVHHCSRHM